MPVGAIIGAAGVGSAVIGSKAAKKAAKTQAAAAGEASDVTLKMYEQTREDLQPYAGTGGSALTSIADMYGLPSAKNPKGGQAFSESALAAFRNSPDYQVALKEGIRARDLSAASKGNLLSGGQEKRIAEYGSDLANMKFGQYMNRLYDLAGMGQNAAAGQGSAATNAGSSLARLALDAGESRAAGTVGSANAITDGISGLGSNLAYLAMRNPSAYGRSRVY
jgi:hypothetical protein